MTVTLDEVLNYWEALKQVNIREVEDKVKFSFEAQRILLSLKTRGLFKYVIVGDEGVGKSSLAIQILNDLFKLVTDDPVKRAELVMFHIFFDPVDAFKVFDKMGKDDYLGAVVFDDAGVWFSGLMFWIDRTRYSLLHGLWQLARSHSSSLILTLPSLGQLPDSMRKSNFYYAAVMHGTAYRNGIWYRVVKVYKRTYSESGIYRKLYMEYKVRDIRMPDEIHRVYWPMRFSFKQRWEALVKKNTSVKVKGYEPKPPPIPAKI